MAGETTKTTALTNIQAGTAQQARFTKGRVFQARDHHQFAAATSLEAADVLITAIELPSNSVVIDIEIYNDDLDTDACCPTLALDVGVSAGADYTSTTSGSDTDHNEDDLIDADLFVDGSTTGQAATTNWTSLTPDSATLGPEDTLKPVWELLGYDNDPKTTFRVSVTSATASAALSSAGDFSIRVTYAVD